MRVPLLLLGGIVVLSVAVARALSCVCSPLECDVLSDEDCPGGLTWDPCRCCKVCARVEGEPCGGLFGFSGSCAVGLQCVIKNLLHHTREVDEGVCAKIPGRWRRHCPSGPIMSDPGCNLVGEGVETGAENVVPTGKCVCGPSVPWCPDEPPPYMYMTRHECKLNLAAKIAYDDLFNSEDTPGADVEGDSAAISGTLSIKCPGDSVPNNSGGCKCAAKCLAHVCPPGQRLVQVRPANPETPGSCCPRYNCVSADSFGNDICPEDSIPTEDGVCKCVPCLPPSCKFGQRSVQVRPAIPGTPGSCCPLYDCRPSESVSWVKTPPEKGKDAGYCIYKGVARKIGEKWNDSQCVNCVCEEDGESCQTTMCKSCENPIPPDPDECCPHCPLMTNVTLVDPGVSCPLSLDDCDLKCDHGYVNDEHDCPICECAKHKLTDTVVSSSPTIETCPDLSHCGPDCEHVKNERGCLVCSCKSSDSSKTSVNKSIAMVDNNNNKICPEVRCDLHCEHGLVMDENDCTFCECKTPNADCPPLVGCKKRCNFGYKTNKRDCPICRCRVMCMDHENKMHPEGTVWHPSSCVTCNCEIGGRLNCKETICSVACNNPLPPKSGTCCPTCPITTVKEDGAQPGMRGWGPVPIMLIVILALLCLLLIVYIVRSRLRGRLSPSEVSYSSYPPQYYKCVPAYDTPMHRNEKIVPL